MTIEQSGLTLKKCRGIHQQQSRASPMEHHEHYCSFSLTLSILLLLTRKVGTDTKFEIEKLKLFQCRQ